MKNRMHDSITKKVNEIIDHLKPSGSLAASEKNPATIALDAIYASAYDGAIKLCDAFDEDLTALDQWYAVINLVGSKPVPLNGIPFTDKLNPDIVRQVFINMMKLVNESLTAAQKKDEIFISIIKRIEIHQHNVIVNFNALCEFARIGGYTVVASKQTETPTEPAKKSDPDPKPQPAATKPAQKQPLKPTEPPKETAPAPKKPETPPKPAEPISTPKTPGTLMNVPKGFIPIDFFIEIDPGRYCMDRNGVVLDRLTFNRVIPEKADNDVAVTLTTKTGGSYSITRKRLLWKSPFMKGYESKPSHIDGSDGPAPDVPKSAATTTSARKIMLPNPSDHCAEIHLPNIPEDKYMINPHGIVWDRYAKDGRGQRLVQFPDKNGRMSVKLIGGIRPGGKNPTIIQKTIRELLYQCFGIKSDGLSDAPAAPDRIRLEAVTKPCEFNAPKEATPEPVATPEPAPNPEPKDEWRFIDFIPNIPKTKYKISRKGGLILNTVTGEKITDSPLHRNQYRVTLTSTMNSAGEHGGLINTYRYTLSILKLVYWAFVDSRSYNTTKFDGAELITGELCVKGKINREAIYPENIRLIPRGEFAKKRLPDNWMEVVNAVRAKKMSLNAGAKACGLSHETFCKYYHMENNAS